MRKFTLEIDCENAAFGDNPVPELKRLLKMVGWSTQIIRVGGPSIVNQRVLDENGNTVGHWCFETDRLSAEVTSKNEAKAATDGLTYGNSSLDDTYLKASIAKDGFAPPFTGGLDEARERRAAKLLPPSDDTYTKATPKGRDYPAKKRKKVKVHPDPQPDTPSLDTSFHDHEMDVD